jgi:hypothetical protein
MGALIWLASYPKSGNTWMRAFLHNLLRNPDKPVPPNELNKFTLGDSQYAWFKLFTDKPATELTLEELAELRPKVHRAMMGAHPDSVFVKTHGYLGVSCGTAIHTMECTAGGIYIVRNPLDVTLSYADHFGLSVDEAIESMASEGGISAATDVQLPEFLNSWSTNVKSWTQFPNPRLHVARYEDMLDKPVKTFAGVARFLGLDPPRARIEKAVRFSSFKTLKKQEEEMGFIERSVHSKSFFRAGKRDQWKSQLSEDQVRRIVEYHREQMQRFGYVPKGF